MAIGSRRMRVLLVGSGGREHALAWKMAQEAEVIAAPGNPGIAEIADCHPFASDDATGLVTLAKEVSADLILFGPEGPLIEGVGDSAHEAGVLALGPSASAARLEGSKAFAKSQMNAAGVPTAEFESFTEPGKARSYARRLIDKWGGVAIKACGAALGKGVVLAGTELEASQAIEDMLELKLFGTAGETIVIEQRLAGPEFSLLTLCNEAGFYSLPVAHDYKRLRDGDEGPNTGGMGSVCPSPRVTPALLEETEARIVKPILAQMRGQNAPFTGVLFSGVLTQDGQPYCLEYNVRFGDPETQSIMRCLGQGFVEALRACAAGEPIEPIETLRHSAVSVVLASAGYPDSPRLGKPVRIGKMPGGCMFFHAGTKRREDGALVTSGGRIGAVSAIGPDVPSARALTYEALTQVQFEGAYHREDIGR